MVKLMDFRSVGLKRCEFDSRRGAPFHRCKDWQRLTAMPNRFHMGTVQVCPYNLRHYLKYIKTKLHTIIDIRIEKLVLFKNDIKL